MLRPGRPQFRPGQRERRLSRIQCTPLTGDETVEMAPRILFKFFSTLDGELQVRRAIPFAHLTTEVTKIGCPWVKLHHDLRSVIRTKLGFVGVFSGVPATIFGTVFGTVLPRVPLFLGNLLAFDTIVRLDATDLRCQRLFSTPTTQVFLSQLALAKETIVEAIWYLPVASTVTLV